MKIRLRILILAVVLAVAFVYAYKNSDWDDPSKENGTGWFPRPSGGERVSQQLVDLFPQRIGYEWFYSGFAEYSHRMELNSIYSDMNAPETLVYKISGTVDDVSDGEGSGDFGLELEYIITEDTVTERIIRGEKLPNMFNEIKILKLPLEIGSKWEQEVNVDGKKATMVSDILPLDMEDSTEDGMDNGMDNDTDDDEDGPTIYRVRYSVPMEGMPDGVYVEERAFAKGKGIIYYARTLGEEYDSMFRYFAFEPNNN